MIRQCFIIFGCLAIDELIVWLTVISIPTKTWSMPCARTLPTDFIARIEWAEKGQYNRNPVAIVNGKKGTEAIVINSKAGQTITLDASKSYDPDGDELSFMWWQQKGIGKTKVELSNDKSSCIKLMIPYTSSNDEIHIICEVHDRSATKDALLAKNSKYTLPTYRRIIIRTK